MRTFFKNTVFALVCSLGIGLFMASLAFFAGASMDVIIENLWFWPALALATIVGMNFAMKVLVPRHKTYEISEAWERIQRAQHERQRG